MNNPAPAVRNVGKRGIKRHVNPLKHEGEDGLFTQTWFPICLSSEVRPGEVLGQTFLDGKVVIFRGENGKINVMSAYCPHVGADLSLGKVQGNNIQCLFHSWEYDETGQCVKTAIGGQVPPNACLFSYPTVERYGIVWVFNGEEPLWDVPGFEKDDSELAFHIYRHKPPYKCDPWLFCCNTLDFQHLIVVHGFQVPDGSVDKLHNQVEWQPFGFDYRIAAQHQGGVSLDWQLGIRGTSIYRQQGVYDDFWFGYIAAFSLPQPGMHEAFQIFAVEKGDGTPESEALVQRRLKIADDLEVRTIEEDRSLLDTMRPAPGNLVHVDKSLGKFYQYLRDYPRAHPGKDFIT